MPITEQAPVCSPCRCGMNGDELRYQEAEIENRIFRDIRQLFCGPGDNDVSSVPFNFHVLDGPRREAVSRGHEVQRDDVTTAAQYLDFVRGRVQQSVQDGEGGVAINEVLRALVKDGDLRPEADAFASIFSVAGQPLSRNRPTRLEQCLSIRTAYEDGLGKTLDKNPEAIRPLPDCDVYVVEDYLGACDELCNVYAEAQKFLGTGHSPQSGEFLRDRRLCTLENAPFLVAEHLQVFKSKRGIRYVDWLDELDQRPLGLVFLPFRVLGQYRASGVWSFQGKFKDDENKSLRDHLEMMAPKAEQWLAPTIGHAVLHASSVLFLRSLSQFNDLLRMPLSTCELTRRALGNLWYTKREPCRCKDHSVCSDSGGLAVSEAFEGLLSATKSFGRRHEHSRNAEIALHVSGDPNIADVLGFDTVGFECPYVPRNVDLNKEVRRADRVFADISASAFSGYQRALAKNRDEVRRKLDMVAHDYANSVYDLIAVSKTNNSQLSAGDPLEKLNLTNSVAKGLLGYAWVTRMMSESADPGASVRTTEGSLILRFKPGNPTQKDIDFWRNYFRREAIYIAFCGFTAGNEQSLLTLRPALRYRFRSSSTDEQFEEIQIDMATLLSSNASRLLGGYLPWPIPAIAAKQKLQADGQLSAMMWGARELIRNATRATRDNALTGQADPWISVDASLHRDESRLWAFSVTVKNPWPHRTKRPPPCTDIASTQRIQSALTQATFRDAPQEPGVAAYIYDLTVTE